MFTRFKLKYLPANYLNAPNAWMNTDLFMDIIVEFDEEMKFKKEMLSSSR